ncbi:MAG: fatty acid--CoA ligase family protein, partial [Candidatus Tectomicrobia bacterium]|nr:fatty acid--CoA ligase family protein [Candidatus Tectomicrobia bacterium]
SCGGVLVLTDRRDPLTVCTLIQEHRVEVLPASPTFLHFLCISGVHENFDLSSLRIITYGSEPMNQITLDRLTALFPQVKIIQKYGTSEFGSPRALSQGNNSLWLKLKVDELGAKVVNNILWVKTETAMLGYLNAPSPFDDDGWLCTGDLVEQDGEWIRIRGRQSDIIIVGGEKVYPQEVENAVLELDFVQDVMVQGERHPLTGQIVTAKINLSTSLDEKTVYKQVRQHCRKRLEPYKLPVKIEVITDTLSTTRQKKIRSCSGTNQSDI